MAQKSIPSVVNICWGSNCSTKKLLCDNVADSQHVMQLCMVSHESGWLGGLRSKRYPQKNHARECAAGSSWSPAICSISGACRGFEHVIFSEDSATV